MSLRGRERCAGFDGHGSRAPLVRASAVAAGLALAVAIPAQAQEAAPAKTSGELTIRADRDTVTVGQRVTFTGRRQPARRGRLVELQFRPPDGGFHTVAEVETNREGRYEVAARPRRSGTFRAVSPRPDGPLRSRRVDVGVRARLTLEARRHQLRERGVKVTGELTPDDAGRRIAVQRQTPKGGWDTVAATKTGDAGAFRARFEPSTLGAYQLRARVGANRSTLGDRVRLDHPVYVYREDPASYYGPGFYGNRTACGQVLREDTVGVAHKRLPCGTRVRFHYRGRTRRIEVIDRGPFIEPRRWDLTEGARRQLDFPRGVDEIWADR